MSNSDKAMKVLLGLAMTLLITGLLMLSDKTIFDEMLIGFSLFLTLIGLSIQIIDNQIK
jgi:hypothetical protein